MFPAAEVHAGASGLDVVCAGLGAAVPHPQWAGRLRAAPNLPPSILPGAARPAESPPWLCPAAPGLTF